jgi:hypothetical protein
MYKGPIYHKASTEEKHLYISGIPHRYWHTDRCKFNPVDFAYTWSFPEKEIRVWRSTQKKWFNSALATVSDGKIKSMAGTVACFSGLPTDDIPMGAAALFAKRTIESGFDAKFVDISRQPEITSLPSLLVIHNLMPRIEYKFYHMLRGIMYKYQECFCIVVIGGDNGLHFFDHLIRRPVSSCVHFEGQLRRSV